MGCPAACAGYELTANLDFAADGMTVTTTGPYPNRNLSLDADDFPDNPWNFGSATTCPTLKTPMQRDNAPVVDSNSDNNLIDINTLHQLNAIRHDLNGNALPGAVAGYPSYAAAFPRGDLVSATPTVARMGCPQTRLGYELADNLDFAADNTAVTTTDAYPDWTSIGNADGYDAAFDGNGRAITRRTIANAVGNAGLFDTPGSNSVIRDLGMLHASISNASTSPYVGILAGNNNGGAITASYASGGTITITGASTTAGGLLGRNAGTIRAVYATMTVSAGTTASSTHRRAGRVAQRQMVTDYDANNNLIDIETLEQLNAIRRDLNGDGLPASTGTYPACAAAFPGGHLSDTGTPYMGCAATCIGYELMANLNFTVDSAGATRTNPYPN